jgi:hypothetical protein
MHNHTPSKRIAQDMVDRHPQPAWWQTNVSGANSTIHIDVIKISSGDGSGVPVA